MFTKAHKKLLNGLNAITLDFPVLTPFGYTDVEVVSDTDNNDCFNDVARFVHPNGHVLTVSPQYKLLSRITLNDGTLVQVSNVEFVCDDDYCKYQITFTKYPAFKMLQSNNSVKVYFIEKDIVKEFDDLDQFEIYHNSCQ